MSILGTQFVSSYRSRAVNWGFASGPNRLGELVYRRTYRRGTERWPDTVERVVEGAFEIVERHHVDNRLTFDRDYHRGLAEEMFERAFSFKFLPPGRGLWLMGTDFVRTRGGAGLNNCAFISTSKLDKDPTFPFTFLMDMSMLGVGVGFDTRGAGKVAWNPGGHPGGYAAVIRDSREGWVEDGLRAVLLWAFGLGPDPEFVYDLVRPFGEPIKGFGGVASGPGPLRELLDRVRALALARAGSPLSSRDIVDLMNMVGACVVAGNVRRCLSEGTKVYTSRGMVPIERVVKGDQVLTAHGYREVTDWVRQGRQNVVRLNLSNGRSIVCTPTHRIARVANVAGEYVWVRAADLSVGDTLLLNSTPCGGATHSPAEAYFRGVVSGDGCVSDRRADGVGSNLAIAFSNDAIGNAMYQRCRNYLASLGKDFKRAGKKPGYFHGRLYDTEFSLSLLPDKTPHHPPRVPAFLYESDPDTRAAYLAGVMDADGTAKRYVLASSKHQEFVDELRSLASSLGIDTAVTVRKPRKLKGRDKEYSPEIVLRVRGFASRQNARALLNPHAVKQLAEKTKAKHDAVLSHGVVAAGSAAGEISREQFWRMTRETRPGNGPRATSHRLLRDMFPGGIWDRAIPVQVASVEELPDEVETYDISVRGEHCFFAEGLLVHNTAEIAFGEADDEEYLDLKDYTKNPDRGAWGWTSNNSVFAKVGQDYSHVAARTALNGEPGYAWLDNMRAFSRMCDPADWRDWRAAGGNPCLEQTLEHGELCCLVEQFPHHHNNLADFKKTAVVSWFYAKAVTLVMTHCELTNEVIRRNRRVGQSLSGVAQFLHARGDAELARWCDETYKAVSHFDRGLSAAWAVPESIKKTSIKPSGTVSLLAGATPGCHFPIRNCYIRRVRYPKSNPDWAALKEAGYHVEPAVIGYADYNTMSGPIIDDRTVVVEFPVKAEPDAPPTEWEVPLERKVEVAVLLQRWWADNQVSCTASFLPEEKDKIAPLLAENDRHLKGISFLPLKADLPYPQMPYESITPEEYDRRVAALKPVVWPEAASHEEEERGCEGGLCEIKPKT